MTNNTPAIWLPVPGYPAYEVSDQGQIRRGSSVLMCTPGPNRYPKTRFGRKSRDTYVHHVVLQAFIGPHPAGMEIRHLDGNPANNTLSNLAYGSHSENIKDQVRHGTNHWANKTRCPRGHDYDAVNTYTNKRGGRVCRECQRNALREWRKRNPGK